MNKIFKQFISVIISLVVVFTTIFSSTLPVSAVTPVSVEGDTFSIWADPENVLNQEKITSFSTDKLSTLGGIKPFKNSSVSTGIYYLFLPSNADCSKLTFWFDGTLEISTENIVSGEPTDVLSQIDNGGISKNYTFTYNGSSHKVCCMKSGDVGTVYVDTNSGSMSSVYNDDEHETSEAGSIMVVQPDGTVDYMGAMDKIQGRGNATWSTSNEKNPFNVKLSTATSLLGMNKAKKWVLLANASDSTLLKNQITYDFAKYIGVKYQPTCKPVDLYINQQYYGSYQLSEKVEINSSRIDVTDSYDNLELANGTVDSATGAVIPADLTGTNVNSVSSSGGYTIGSKKYSESLKNPTDSTGGYLYELEISDRWIEENAGFCAYNKQCWVLKNCDYASTDMINYSYNLLYALGSAAYNNGVVPSSSTKKTYTRGTCNNPAPAEEYQGKKWNDILDSDSLIRYYWVEELFKNLDASTSSAYFYKDSDKVDSKLYAGPVWDMDKCWGYVNTRWGCDISSYSDWYAKKVRIYKFSSSTDLFATDSTDLSRPLALVGQLMSLNDAWKDAQRYWYRYVSPAIDILNGTSIDETGQLQSIQSYCNTILKSATMNAARFSTTNTSDGTYSNLMSTLKNWITNRQSWINEQFEAQDIAQTTSVADIEAQTYTGDEIKPGVTVTGNINSTDFTLEEGIDYTTEYTDNVNAGTATVKINGIGMYSGSISKTFVINPADISTGYTATIDEYNYMDNTLSVDFKAQQGKTFESSINYQWYQNENAIDGATQRDYTVTVDDVGTNIVCKVSGDNQNITGEVTSNACKIKVGQQPTGFTKTIAAWNYDYTNNADGLTNADETNLTHIYNATSGENQSSSTLTATVDAVNDAKIKWSDTDLYENGDVSDQAPVIGTSKTDLRAWGEYPYFETTISTSGYENLTFSAKLGGSKKGPRDWKLQYSLDGEKYYDVDGATYSITKNKTLEQAFDNVSLPAQCNNQSKVYIRMVVYNDIAINGTNTVIGQLSGDAAVNDIVITGSSTGIVTSLKAPSFDVTKDNIFDDETITLSDNNGGADLYYTVNGVEKKYTDGFSVFDASTSKIGDTVTISAVAKFDDIISPVTEKTYTFAGVDINNFSYDSYSTETIDGKVNSTGGTYSHSGKMTAVTDGKSQYVPLWNEENASFSVSPDDGALWTENSGFTYCVSTAGFENITFTADAYTTNSGPKSLTLQYSTNGYDFTDVTTVNLTANGALENAFSGVKLPDECNHLSNVYIRLATKENSTFAGDTLHNNLSKGNLYVNNVVIAGQSNGYNKMPYTNKSTSYFGTNGTINYYSPDDKDIKYCVFNSNGDIVQSGNVSESGIKLSDSTDFYKYEKMPYTVVTWVGDTDSKNTVFNTKTFYYKGDTVTKFDFTSSKRPIANYTTDYLNISNTSGVKSATVSMLPNGVDKTTLSYTDTYGLKASWSEENIFNSAKKLNTPDDNGCWLIETSTVGYANLTLSLDQISSNKGPRDWGVAYSIDGKNYTYVENSNARAISNDVSSEPVETYSNLTLPNECSNREKLYIKIFINGGESVDGDELETLLKGNTGINNIEISGIKIPNEVSFTVNTVAENAQDVSINSKVYINGTEYETNNGTVQITTLEGKTLSVKASMNGKTYFTNEVKINVDETQSYTMSVFALDPVADNVVNAKDYAYILHHFSADERTKLIKAFKDYLNN